MSQKLSPLEQRIFDAIEAVPLKHDYWLGTSDDYKEYARVAAMVCKDIAREAYKAGMTKYMSGLPDFVIHKDFEEWLKK